MIPIYVFGSSNTDMVVKAQKLPGPGETVIGDTFLMNPGGKGANQAIAAARLGGSVTFVAKVGNDLFGKQALQQFQREKINTVHVKVDPDNPSGVALIGVDKNGENSIMVASGSNSHLKKIDVEGALEQNTRPGIALIQLEIPIDTVEYAIERCYQQNMKVILNPAPAQKLNLDVLKHLFVITPNESEAELLTGIKITNEDSIMEAAKILLNLGVENVVLTLGSKGAFLFNKSISQIIPAPPVTPMDTTAAGDCFNGALAVALSENFTLEKAIAFACKAASISVTRMGAQSSLPTRKEVDELYLTVV
ncbi:MAG TPA: ribokinase [Chryseolinea sp.]|nr:ribokinase [Chryseolinea sp.]